MRPKQVFRNPREKLSRRRDCEIFGVQQVRKLEVFTLIVSDQTPEVRMLSKLLLKDLS